MANILMELEELRKKHAVMEQQIADLTKMIPITKIKPLRGRELAWKMIELLMEYKEANNDCNVPQAVKPLGPW